jgi:uridine kinase
MSSLSSQLSQLKQELNSKTRSKPYLIGISGGSGGGKTSVANLIHKSLGRDYSLLFSMDTYYKDLTPEQEKDLSNYNFDSPEALDLDLLYQHLNDLMQWKKIQMPTYDFATNKRQEKTIELTPAKVIIFEGILAFYDKRMRDLMDLKIFIDLDDDIRLSRRIYRDIISRGRKMETVLERYHKFVKTAYNNFIKPTKEYADIIIPRGGSNTIAIDLINYHLKYLIGNVKFKNDKGDIVEKKDDEENKKLIKQNFMVEEFYSKETIEGLSKKDIFNENEEFCLVNKDEEDMFLDMFKNYLKNNQYQYFDLYMDIYTKKIKECIDENDLIIISNDDQNKIDLMIKEKLKKNKSINIVYFIPILFTNAKRKHLKIFKYLNNIEHIDTIKLISVFSEQNPIYEIKNHKFIFKCIYSGKKMENYYIYIENYGFYSKTDEENSNNLISFSEDNFERRLFELIEADKKKDNLSMIYKYLEDEE